MASGKSAFGLERKFMNHFMLIDYMMKDHITTIVKRYKGRIKGWDVVNEAIEDNGAYRKTKFYEILGEEYIPLAFQYAHEAGQWLIQAEELQL